MAALLKQWRLFLIVILNLPLFSMPVEGEEGATIEASEVLAVTHTLDTLKSFVKLREGLQRDIKALNKQIKKSQSDVERKTLVQQLDQLKADLRTTTKNFEDIAADVDMSHLRKQDERVFSLQQEVLSLLKPVFNEMKDLTSDVRHKSNLKEEIALYHEKLPVFAEALINIDELQQKSNDASLKKALEESATSWRKQQTFMQSELEAAQLQLQNLLASQASITEASQSYFKSFVRQRGLYLTVAVLVVVGLVLLSRLIYMLMHRLLPGFGAEHHSLAIRLLELFHRVFTVLLLILGPMVVFYWVEDWVLFSLSLLFLLGIALTLRKALPHYWHQIHLFLNIGAVREGERIVLDGLPWRVQRINLFCQLVNPVAEFSQRIPINQLVGLKSRPYNSHEPWFPCKKNDWVILSDGVRGKVTGISPEMVRLVERGGATFTYLTSDFLTLSPRNLATNFRIKQTLGISYSLQENSTTDILDTLHYYILGRIKEEGYGNKLVNLGVEFEQAGDSSLNLVVLADFNGSLGHLYNRLSRATQRWCVDACTEFGWEIPFPQMMLHSLSSAAASSTEITRTKKKKSS